MRGVLDPAEIAAAAAVIEIVLAVPGPLAQEGGTLRAPWHQDQPYHNVDGHGVSAVPVVWR